MLQLPVSRLKRSALLGLVGFFVVAGANHFLNPAFYVGMMPPYLPAHLEIVYLSGALEVLGGVAVLSPSLRSRAGWALVGLLVAVFPANLHMAFNADLFPEMDAALLYARLPVQGLFIFWAYWATRANPDLAEVESREDRD